MSHLVLARKYRPQRFGALVGQEHVTKTLRGAIESGRIAHAFLFTGIRGVGKTTAARLLAKALNCERAKAPTADPCGECSNCKEIAEGRAVDVAEIDGASNRGIDAIRDLTDNVRYAPAKSRFRVYIVDEAHMVTREAFNALLKTLEEPPPHVKFVFATTAVDKFPETILSRCQRYDFRRIPIGHIKEELARIAAEEKTKVTPDALFAVAREAQGSLRDAESLLEQLMAAVPAGGTIEEPMVAESLGVVDRRTLFGAVDAVLAGDARRCLEICDAMHDGGRDLQRFGRDFLEHWRNLVAASVAPDGSALRDLPEEEIAVCRRQAGERTLAELLRLFRLARQGDEELQRSSYPRLVLEMLMVRLATLVPVLPVDEALRRLDEIERRIGGAAEGTPRAPAAPLRSEAPVRAETPAPRPAAPLRPAAAGSNGGGAGEAAAAASPLAPPPAVEAPEPAPPTVAAAGDGAAWTAFLDFVQKKGRVTLYFNLRQARPLEEAPGRIVLGVARENCRRELSTRETLSVLEELLAEFHGSPTRVRIEAAAVHAPSPQAPSIAPAEMMEIPAVKKAVEILGGEVREVRSRRTVKESS